MAAVIHDIIKSAKTSHGHYGIADKDLETIHRQNAKSINSAVTSIQDLNAVMGHPYLPSDAKKIIFEAVLPKLSSFFPDVTDDELGRHIGGLLTLITALPKESDSIIFAL